jgi:hypothetical protein
VRESAVAFAALGVLTLGVGDASQGQVSRARDPGVRGGAPGAGEPLPGLSAAELEAFEVGKEACTRCS